MNDMFANWLVEIDNGDTQAEVVEGYSGRGMYGHETTAVSTDDPIDLLLAAMREAVENPDDVPKIPGGLSRDSLGTGTVMY